MFASRWKLKVGYLARREPAAPAVGRTRGCYQAAAQTWTVLATFGPCYIQPGLAA